MESTFSVLEEGTSGETGGDDAIALELFVDFGWDAAEKVDVGTGNGVGTVTFSPVIVEVHVIDVCE